MYQQVCATTLNMVTAEYSDDSVEVLCSDPLIISPTSKFQILHELPVELGTERVILNETVII